ncbi:MAG: Rpn family recombination-promoting nuclease/putative transposase, partial [Candidatus Sericytochromatia bacterium]|nr:Rpn family recombination-promoting nuclease/putative transposase [Candidatus Sericytochromatia bacterium]
MINRLIRFDWAIKNILRNKSNFGILEGFLSELLKEDIKITKILESESNQETKKDKFNRVDLLVENSKSELIIVEVQNTSELDYLQRLLYGASKVISENLNLGQSYSNIKKIISISIVYFDLGQGKDYVYKGKTSFQGIHKKDTLELSKEQKKLFGEINVEQIFPEYYLLKVNKFDNKTRDTLDEWLYFLKNEEIKDNFKAKGLREAKEKLDVLKLPKREQAIYQRYLENLSYQASMAQTISFEVEQEREKMLIEVQAEKDKLQIEKDEVKTQKNELKTQKYELKTEKDKLRIEKDELKTEKNELKLVRKKVNFEIERIKLEIEKSEKEKS